MDTESKQIKSMLIGHFLGDALGLPYEWYLDVKTYKGNLSNDHVHAYEYGQLTITDYGQVSDDSEMTIILYRHLKANNLKLNKNELVLEYLKWANHKTCFAMGRHMNNLFVGAHSIDDYEDRCKYIDPFMQSNGTIMRCSPLAIIEDEEEMMKLAEIECSITNPNPINITINKVYLKILRGCLTHKDVNKILLDAYLLCEHDVIKKAFNEGLCLESRDINTCIGWCVHPIYCVVYCLTNFKTYTEANNWVISQGGDADTNACIVGAVFGALLGLDKLLEEQRHNIKILLNCDTKGGNKVRPEYLIPKNLFSYDAL